MAALGAHVGRPDSQGGVTFRPRSSRFSLCRVIILGHASSFLISHSLTHFSAWRRSHSVPLISSLADNSLGGEGGKILPPPVIQKHDKHILATVSPWCPLDCQLSPPENGFWDFVQLPVRLRDLWRPRPLSVSRHLLGGEPFVHNPPAPATSLTPLHATHFIFFIHIKRHDGTSCRLRAALISPIA